MMQAKVNPSNLKFSTSFSKDECYKELTGKCSLDEYKPAEKIERVPGKRSSKEYCPHLSLTIDTTLEDDPIEIIDFECGHYGIQCGRHRICISKKYNLCIPVDISKEEGICPACKGEEILI